LCFGSHHDQLLDLDARFALTMLGQALAPLPDAERPGRVRPTARGCRSRTRTRSRSKPGCSSRRP
jgi:hypothetical protein